jgi:hypothetical protein
MSSTRQDEALEFHARWRRRAAASSTRRCPAAWAAPRRARWPSWPAAAPPISPRPNRCCGDGAPTLVGPAGSGQVAKLCNQLIVGATINIVAEALLLAQAAGADPAAVREAIRGGFAGSRVLEVHGQRMLERNFVPGGQVKTPAEGPAQYPGRGSRGRHDPAGDRAGDAAV